MTTFLTVASKVAKSLFSTSTSDLLSRFMTVLFPTFVYPTNAQRNTPSRDFRWVKPIFSMSWSLVLSNAILSRKTRRSVSISFSPGPFIPIPPFCLDRCVHIPVNRGNMKILCANSTWVLACAVLAFLAKMSRIRWVRLRIFVFSNSVSMFRTWAGVSSSSKMTRSILCLMTYCLISSSLPLPT